MSRIVEREVIEDDRDVVVGDRSYFASPLAIAVAVIAIVLLLWFLIATPWSNNSGGGTNTPTRDAPARDTGTDSGGSQTGGETGETDTGGQTGGNTDPGADSGTGGTP